VSSVELLDRLAGEPARAAILLDVDGVLAPIAPPRAAARVPDGTRRELARLNATYGLVACVTGRPSAVAREIVGVPGLTVVGEHGLELDPDAPAWADRIAAFADAAEWPAERKALTLAFHYRTTEDPEAARTVLERVAARAGSEGFRTRWGRMVLEVLPPLDASKGTAVRRLLEDRGLRRALYAGDDTTDLDAFAALDGLEVAVRVAVSSPDGPDELRERADVVVASMDDLARLLREL
jgi:trehalose 6-phosphate phosphatase